MRLQLTLAALLLALPTATRTGFTGEPASAAAFPLAAQTLNAAGEGRRVFLRYNCYGCHGAFGAGGMARNIRGENGIAGTVLHGEDTGMIGFSKYLTTTDLANLQAYLNSMGTPGEPKFFDWWVPVPPK